MAVSDERFLEWIMDSGGSFHMTPRRNFLFDFKEFIGGTMKGNCVYSLDGWAESGEASVGIQEKESLAQMRCLLIQHGWEAALDPFPRTMMDAEKTTALKIDVYKKAHGALLLCLDNKVLREVNKEDSVAGVWLKLETLYMTKSVANKLYLKKKLFTFYMHSDVDIDDEDQALMLLTSLQYSYYNFEETLLYGRKSLTLEDVLSSLNPWELKKRTDAKDDGDGLYVRGRSDHRELIMDSGGSFHMTPRRNFLFDFKEFIGGMVLLGDNRACAIMGIGK
nr:retrovirus-related Pol polyprotein from transposon TNT 1-94 [Tanacetum cinerariifolium]